MTEQDRLAHGGQLARYVATRAPYIIGTGREVTALRKDGSVFPAMLSLGALADSEPPRGAVIPVIFITGHGDIAMAVEAMQQGAFDFLQEPFRDQDLIDRIQRALQKDRANRGVLSKRSRIRERRDSLTPRELEVLALVTSGKANKVMAGDLGLSQRTIEIYRARVMEKMGASSLAHLVRMDLEQDGHGAAKSGSAS